MPYKGREMKWYIVEDSEGIWLTESPGGESIIFETENQIIAERVLAHYL